VYEKILVAVDGSESSQHALDHAAPLARAFGAKVLVLTVAEDEWDHEDRKAAARKIVNEAISAASLEGVETVPLVAFGEPEDQIVEIAEDQEADLIVVGNRGLSGLRSFLLGSVSYKVARSAHRPVLIVHREDEE